MLMSWSGIIIGPMAAAETIQIKVLASLKRALALSCPGAEDELQNKRKPER